MADQPHPRVPPSVWRNPWHFLAFGLGSGTLPKAPGTWGSLLGLAAVPLLQWLPLWGYAGVLLAASLLGIWLCGRVADDLGVHDHEGIVWDEFVGIWLTLFLAPLVGYGCVWALCCFASSTSSNLGRSAGRTGMSRAAWASCWMICWRGCWPSPVCSCWCISSSRSGISGVREKTAQSWG